MSENIATEFVLYYRKLSKLNSSCRIFERNDNYCFYGDDSDLINKILPASKVKTMGLGNESLNYVTITKGHLVKALQHLLFILQYKIEIYRNTGSARTPLWTVVGKASPGNVAAVEDILFPDDNSYVMTQRGVMAIKIVTTKIGLNLGIAFCDPLLREIQMCQFTEGPQMTALQTAISQLSPQECLLASPSKSKKLDSTARYDVEEVIKMHKIAVTDFDDFNDDFLIQDLNRLVKFDEGKNFQTAMRVEFEMKVAHSAVAAVIKYLELLSDENNFGQYNLAPFISKGYAKVDLSCEIGLGLFPESKTDYHDKNYLFGLLNSCFTSAGERLLIRWIKQPLMDIRKLEERLNIVEIFVTNLSFQNNVSKVLEKFIDVEMLCRKIQRRKASLQDLYKIYQMLLKLPALTNALQEFKGRNFQVLKHNFIDELDERIEDFDKLTSMISQTIDFDAVQNREFIVKAEFNETLSDIKKQMTKLRESMDAELENTKDDLELPSVKLELFDKLGYAFRVTLKEEYRLRNKKIYTLIDTRTSGVRFQTPSLKKFSDQYIALRNEYERFQKDIVDEMVDVSASYIRPLKLLGVNIAWLDVALALARLATKGSNKYTRPQLNDSFEDSRIVLKKCRHPVLDEALSNYIPNDMELTKDKHKFYFVTGPNMGGKSTFIRSVALNVLLAQIGSFVPCEFADITVVDAIFTRIGACDKPSKAMSTFMYEMLEIKSMVNCATRSSLLIIDEMGRGTSTFDGFGLSWSISEFIATELKSPCLFATHFHDLTNMSKTVPSVGNLYVNALSSNKGVTFLYEVKPGVCGESLGIHVSNLASFPEKTIVNAEQKLKDLEGGQLSFNEIAEKFSGVPNGKKFLDLLRELYPPVWQLSVKPMKPVQKSCVDSDSASEDENSSHDPQSLTMNLEESKSKRLVDILEEMAKNAKS